MSNSTNTPKMSQKQPKSEPVLRNILDLQKLFPDEKACREALSFARWKDTPTCVHCGSKRKIYQINDGKILKCADCRKQFTVRVGTIFEDSALPLTKWFMAIYVVMAHKKGISSHQLGRDIGVRQATAWFMLHRIRHAVRTGKFNIVLSGTVEADETWIGGKKDRLSAIKKATVLGMVERDGKVVAAQVRGTSSRYLWPHINKHVKAGSKLMTDEYSAYEKLGKQYEHQTVVHSKKEYVRGEVHTNTMESFWALLKRGIHGIYHHVSKKHLDKYIDEFEYRYNSRKGTDPSRFFAALTELEGRLTYKTLTS